MLEEKGFSDNTQEKIFPGLFNGWVAPNVFGAVMIDIVDGKGSK